MLELILERQALRTALHALEGDARLAARRRIAEIDARVAAQEVPF